MKTGFRDYIDKLIECTEIVIDRPKYSSHPRFPGSKYPADYGYLKSTRSSDSSGVDVWVGTKSTPEVDGFLATIDLQKMDYEIKLVVGCTGEELAMIEQFHNTQDMRAIYIPRAVNRDYYS